MQYRQKALSAAWAWLYTVIEKVKGNTSIHLWSKQNNRVCSFQLQFISSKSKIISESQRGIRLGFLLLTHFMPISQFLWGTKILYKSVSSEKYLWHAYSSLFPCFILFHFVIERKDWHIPLWLMSLGIFRVVPLIKIFIFIQNVISMKLQKESHPSILAMKMQNKQLKVYVFYLS